MHLKGAAYTMISRILSFISHNKLKLIIVGMASTAIAVMTGKALTSGGKTETPVKTKKQVFSEELKQALIKEAREILGADDALDVTFAFARSAKNGFWGYYLKTGDIGALLLCYSDELEDAFGRGPFWLELDETATASFRDAGLKREYDIYSHPRFEERIAIPLSRAAGIDAAFAAETAATLISRLRGS